jgi:uncharacterized membrane protein
LNKKTKDRLGLLVLFGVIASILLYKLGPEVIQSRYFYDGDVGHRGAIGDAFGGTVGPIVALIAAILTFMAFYIQYESNKEQKSQFKKQAQDTVIERFENRFFELVRLHRSNVEEQNIQNIVFGRKTFTTYYFELRYIYLVLEKSYDSFDKNNQLDKEQLSNLAYLIFFFGIGHATESVFKHVIPEIYFENFFNKAIERLKNEKDNFNMYIKSRHNTRTINGYKILHLKDLVVEHNNKKAVFIQNYEPFTGHGTKIGHYYRHLFQTVKYVASQKHKLFTPDRKYEYVKTLRAQLSNFEQVLLFYNSISILGKAWINEKYIQDYNLITNLPLSFADFGITPEEKFKDTINEKNDFFDWYSLQNSK